MISITVADRIASITTDGPVVAGNTYPVSVSLDSEWTGTLYLRARFGSLYYDIPFESSASSVDVQMPVGYPEIGLGVYSEALQICTNEARLKLLRSIVEAGESVVEFDGDLYDQWAGEVTSLLVDAEFDAESARPLQNAVITAWKATVPEDSALVHKTGNETIAGAKTFKNNITAETTGRTVLDVVTTSESDANVAVRYSGAYLSGGSSPTMIGEVRAIRSGTSDPQGRINLSVKAPDQSREAHVFVICRNSGTAYAESPTFTADNSADAKIVNRAMLASSPTVVHTTGSETIAGAKTFTGAASFRDVLISGALRLSAVDTPTLQAGRWVRTHVVTPATSAGAMRVVIEKLTALGRPVEASVLITAGGASVSILAERIGDTRMVLARRISDGKVEVWVSSAQSRVSIPTYYRHAVETDGATYNSDPPVVGAVYDIVVPMEDAAVQEGSE